MNALAAKLPVMSYENLSDEVLTKEDQKRLMGRSATELTANGWYCKDYDLKDMKFRMQFGSFVYTLTLDGDDTAIEYFDPASLNGFTILSIDSIELGDATDVF